MFVELPLLRKRCDHSSGSTHKRDAIEYQLRNLDKNSNGSGLSLYALEVSNSWFGHE